MNLMKCKLWSHKLILTSIAAKKVTKLSNPPYPFLELTPFRLSVILSSSERSFEAFDNVCFEFGSKEALLAFISSPPSYSSLR